MFLLENLELFGSVLTLGLQHLHFQMLPSCGRWKELFTLFWECKQIQALWPFSSRRLQDIGDSWTEWGERWSILSCKAKCFECGKMGKRFLASKEALSGEVSRKSALTKRSKELISDLPHRTCELPHISGKLCFSIQTPVSCTFCGWLYIYVICIYIYIYILCVVCVHVLLTYIYDAFSYRGACSNKEHRQHIQRIRFSANMGTRRTPQ